MGAQRLGQFANGLATWSVAVNDENGSVVCHAIRASLCHNCVPSGGGDMAAKERPRYRFYEGLILLHAKKRCKIGDFAPLGLGGAIVDPPVRFAGGSSRCAESLFSRAS
jgi:hypothetical protein